MLKWSKSGLAAASGAVVAMAGWAGCQDEGLHCPDGDVPEAGVCVETELNGAQPQECPAGLVRRGDACVASDQSPQWEPEWEDDSAGPGDGDADRPLAPEGGITGGEVADDSVDAAMDAAPPVNDGGPEPVCFLDHDHDGFGSGEALGCPEQVLTDASMPDGNFLQPDGSAEMPDGGKPLVVPRGDDCDDENPEIHPGAAEFCDGVDTDCDGELDVGALNACGGDCTAVLTAHPGAPCDNGERGACFAEGVYVCDGTDNVVCDAPPGTVRDEICGDGIDNDCDGQTDERDAVDAELWFKDCDGDGYAASSLSSRYACEEPEGDECVGWTAVFPRRGSTQDCDDTTETYRPGRSEFGWAPSASRGDYDCNGAVQHEPVVVSAYETTAGSFEDEWPLCTEQQLAKYESGNCGTEPWHCAVFEVAGGFRRQPQSACELTSLNTMKLIGRKRSFTGGTYEGTDCQVNPVILLSDRSGRRCK